MQIALKQIEPSPRPVRTSWDEKKMEELAQSIKEQGVIVPIKIRPKGNHAQVVGVHKWEIVYGHRRVEACRRAGLVYIEAIMEEVEDTDALIQALIENVVREDLGPMDVARGLKRLKDVTGWSAYKIGQRGIMSRQRVSEILSLLEEPVAVQDMISGKHSTGPVLSAEHVIQVSRVNLSDTDKIAVVDKATEEGLTAKQTRHVADALKQAPTSEVRKRILDIPVARSPELWAERVRAETHEVRERETVWWDHYVNTKDFVEEIARTKRLFLKAWESVEKEQIAPEHMPYLAKRLRQLSAVMEQMAQQLDDKRVEAIGG